MIKDNADFVNNTEKTPRHDDMIKDSADFVNNRRHQGRMI
jgi:hypothetical protein